MTWFIAYDRASGAAKWHGECPEPQLADQETEAIGVIPLLRKGLVWVEEDLPTPEGGTVKGDVQRIDLSAAAEALVAQVDAGAQAATALAPAAAASIETARQAARAAVEEAAPNLAAMALAAAVDWGAIAAGGQ